MKRPVQVEPADGRHCKSNAVAILGIFCPLQQIPASDLPPDYHSLVRLMPTRVDVGAKLVVELHALLRKTYPSAVPLEPRIWTTAQEGTGYAAIHVGCGWKAATCRAVCAVVLCESDELASNADFPLDELEGLFDLVDTSRQSRVGPTWWRLVCGRVEVEPGQMAQSRWWIEVSGREVMWHRCSWLVPERRIICRVV